MMSSWSHHMSVLLKLFLYLFDRQLVGALHWMLGIRLGKDLGKGLGKEMRDIDHNRRIC